MDFINVCSYGVICKIVKNSFYPDAKNFLIAIDCKYMHYLLDNVKEGCGICGNEITNSFGTGYCTDCEDICPGCNVPELQCFGIS